jgi:DNA-binding CsgD family transcriptional regulator
MPLHESDPPVDWDRITIAKARVLAQFVLRHTESETARALGITTNGVKSHVRSLKEITDCTSVRELGAWWAEASGEWVRHHATAAGFEIPPRVRD